MKERRSEESTPQDALYRRERDLQQKATVCGPQARVRALTSVGDLSKDGTGQGSVSGDLDGRGIKVVKE